MRTSISTRRAAAALAITALGGLLTITPAHAEARPGDDGVITPAEVRVWEDAQSKQRTAPRAANPATPPVVLDDNAVEYLQIALGALGGVAVVGGLVAASSARQRGHAHPA
jgi:hypothetical protein